MNIRNTLLIAFGLAMSVSVHAQSPQTDKAWLVVLEDPRPARLRGWQRSDYSTGHYSSALEIQRAGRRVANQYDLVVQTEWFIESLNLYCLIAMFDGDEQTTIENLRADENVKWVQSSNNFKLLQASNLKQLSSEQLSFEQISPKQIAPALLKPLELQLPQTLNGKDVTIALIDSAVDDEHPDISESIAEHIDFVADQSSGADGEAHGTAMAGVIIADQQSDIGVTGIAGGAKLQIYRGCWELIDGSQGNSANCSTLSLARALDKVATSPANVLNLSLSGPKDELLDQLMAQIVANGTLVVTAFDPNRPADDRFPSPSPGILTVQAEEPSLDKSKKTFSAPGTKIVASPGKQANLMSGHSIAAAYTSGTLALCMQLEAQLEKQICGPRVFQTLFKKNIVSLQALTSTLTQELTKLAQR